MTAPGRRVPRRREVAPAIVRQALDARGPSAELKMLWLQLWSYRARWNAVPDRTQAELAALFGCHERALRERLFTARQYGMLTCHGGLNGKPSLYVLAPPAEWLTAPEHRPALFPARPPVIAAGAGG